MTCKYCGGAGFVEVDVGQILECNMCLAEQKQKRLGYQYVTPDVVINDPYDSDSDILLNKLGDANNRLDVEIKKIQDRNKDLANRNKELVNRLQMHGLGEICLGVCVGMVLMFVLGFIMLSIEGYI